tara:strand:+ start:14070 stop:14255 length:186 start_codon:yes stop_codon:yes gene_type:complete
MSCYTQQEIAKNAAGWRRKEARDEHPGRGFCREQAERWESELLVPAERAKPVSTDRAIVLE